MGYSWVQGVVTLVAGEPKLAVSIALFFVALCWAPLFSDVSMHIPPVTVTSHCPLDFKFLDKNSDLKKENFIKNINLRILILTKSINILYK